MKMKKPYLSSLPGLAALLLTLWLLPDGDPALQVAIFGFIGKAVKGLAKGVGGLLGKVAPIASVIPGLGPLAALGGSAAGRLLSGLGGGGGQQQIPGMMGLPGMGGIMPGQPQQGAGGSIFGIPLSTIADIALGAGGALSAGRARGESNEVLRQAIERERQEAGARSQYRGMLGQQLGELAQGGGGRDLSQEFADPTNPFATAPEAPKAPTMRMIGRPTGRQRPARKPTPAGVESQIGSPRRVRFPGIRRSRFVISGGG